MMMTMFSMEEDGGWHVRSTRNSSRVKRRQFSRQVKSEILPRFNDRLGFGTLSRTEPTLAVTHWPLRLKVSSSAGRQQFRSSTRHKYCFYWAFWTLQL